MASYGIVKGIARRLGVYRQARWFNSRVLNRAALNKEKQEFAFYRNLLRQGDLVFDVGANYGDKTRVFLQLGAKVIAFEPQADCRKELEARCGKSRNLVTLGYALGSRPGRSLFFARSHKGASGLIKSWRDDIESEFEVSIVTLDSMIKTYGRPKYIKIDVEGFEYEVLKGLSEPIPYISFEYHLEKPDGVEKTISCVEHLSRFGHLAINITPAEDLVFPDERWMTIEQFRQTFPVQVSSWKGFGYGDMFVRTNILVRHRKTPNPA